MSDMTRVLAYKTEDEAKDAIYFWQSLGYHVAVAGPTDAVQLYNGPGGGDDPIWESGPEADWYVLLVTKAKLELVAMPQPS